MSNLYIPQEIVQAERIASGFKHVSVFLAQAFEQQATEQAKAAAADQVPPGAEDGKRE